MKIKRIISLAAAAILSLNCSVPALAAEAADAPAIHLTPASESITILPQNGGTRIYDDEEAAAAAISVCSEDNSPTVCSAAIPDYAGAKAALITAFENCTTTPVVLSQYNIPASEFGSFYISVVLTNPQYLVETQYRFSTTSVNTMGAITPSYVVPNTAELTSLREFSVNTADKWLSEMPSGLSDMEKIFWLHSKICDNVEYYDEYGKELSMSDYPEYCFVMSGVFSEKRPVCQGYAQAFYYMAKKLGFNVAYCRSSEISHIWNCIELDGKWYHIDLTWDDPLGYTDTATRIDYVQYTDFLTSSSTALRSKQAYYDKNKSDDTDNTKVTFTYITANDYVNSTALFECTDTSFESGWIFNKFINIDRTSDNYYSFSCDFGSFSCDFHCGGLKSTSVLLSDVFKYSDNTNSIIVYAPASVSLNLVYMKHNTDGSLANCYIDENTLTYGGSEYSFFLTQPPHLQKIIGSDIKLTAWALDTLTPLSYLVPYNYTVSEE